MCMGLSGSGSWRMLSWPAGTACAWRLVSDEEDAGEAAEEADGHAPAQFAEGVLPEDEAGGAYHAAQEHA